MDQEIVPVSTNSILPADLLQKARDYAFESKAANSRRAAQSDWRSFTGWCATNGLSPLPATPETIALYLTAQADRLKPATLQRHLATIASAHAAAGIKDQPTKSNVVKAVWSGIKRTKGVAQVGKSPILTVDLRMMVAALPDSYTGVRDRAILLLGYSGAFRRSELVALDIIDLEFNPDGVTVNLRKSKTDQEGMGTMVGIPHGHNAETCPVLALRRWLEVAAVTEGPIFRAVDRHGNISEKRLTSQVVALVVKRSAERVGLDPVKLGGHSLRAGLATQAAINGVADRTIMRQTRHKSHAVFSRYIRVVGLYKENAAGSVGL